MATRSMGSCSLPSISRVTTWGLPDRELEALPAHGLDQDRQLQLAAALHLPGVGALGRADPQRDVADQLGVEAALDQAGGELRAVGAGQRRGVDADGHGQAGLVDGDGREGRPGRRGRPGSRRW